MAKNPSSSKKPEREWPARIVDPTTSTRPCEPGSIEQQLDMCETGKARGDEITHQHGVLPEDEAFVDVEGIDKKIDRMKMDLSEPSREGDEMSGDDHSSGLQGGESELKSQPHIEAGLPGEELERRDRLEQKDFQGETDNVVFLRPGQTKKKRRERG